MAESEFVVRCPFAECTTQIFAGGKVYKLNELDDEINSGSDFGKKLGEARDEVLRL